MGARLIVVAVGMAFAAPATAQPSAPAGYVHESTAPRGPSGFDPIVPPPTIERPYAVGYKRGIGLDNYGASIGYAMTLRLVPALNVFVLHDVGQRGFALAPSIQLNLVEGQRSTPYFEAGVQYLRMWFGDASGGGFGGFGSVGYELRFAMGMAIQLGLGLHGKQKIKATDGVVTMSQAPTLGLHWDAGLRYWF